MESELMPPALLQELREKFHYVETSPYAGRRIFLDSVSGALRLKTMGERALEEVISYAQKKRVDPASEHFAEVKQSFKEDAHLLFGSDEGHIMPAMSGTHAIFRCVNAVCAGAREGANIVTSSLEHPAAYEATELFARQYGLERRVADFDPASGRVRPQDVLELVDEETALLMLIHGSNVTGAINDIEEIVSRAREINYDLFAVIDGVQYAPHGLIDVEKLDVDAYVISGYKLFGKKASGIAWFNDRFDRLPHWQFSERPEGEWALGAEDEATYAGFSAVIDYLRWLGHELSEEEEDRLEDRKLIGRAFEGIKAHTCALMELALEGDEDENIRGLKDMGRIRLMGWDGLARPRTGLISFRAAGLDSNDLAEKYFHEARISLSTREDNIYGRHVLKVLDVEDLIRASICHYNSPDEIREFLQATKKLQHGEEI